MTLCVQYGCGLSCPEGWLNFDASPRLRIESHPLLGKVLSLSEKALFPKGVLYGDIVTGLPVENESVDYAYCSHVLEHLDRQSIVCALDNTYRMLKPCGVFRLVVPDLTWRVERLLEAQKQKSSIATDEFMDSCRLGERAPYKGAIGKLRLLYGNSMHRWMYDFALLSQLLKEAGFENIRRCEFGDAKADIYQAVESENRFVDASGNAELAIEAIKK